MKLAEVTRPDVRKIYLDFQRLEGRHLLQTTALMHLWIISPQGCSLPPTRESVPFIQAVSDLVQKGESGLYSHIAYMAIGNTSDRWEAEGHPNRVGR